MSLSSPLARPRVMEDIPRSNLLRRVACGITNQSADLDLERTLVLLEQNYSSHPTSAYLSVLKSCRETKSLLHVIRLQSLAFSGQAEPSEFLLDHLLLTLFRSVAFEEASQLFHRLPRRSTFSWTAIISGLVGRGRHQEALNMYPAMLQDGHEPDRYTFVIFLKACASLQDLNQGKALHKDAEERGLTSNVYMCTALVHMYGKCGAIDEAENVFVRLSQSHVDVVLWNAMLTVYIENGNGSKALSAYRQMHADGVHPDQQTYTIALLACCLIMGKKSNETNESGRLIGLEIGGAFHAESRKKFFTSNTFVRTTLLHMYGKCDSILMAEHVFCDDLFDKNVTSWNSMISAYVECGHGKKALHSFIGMQESGIGPCQKTFVIALQACLCLNSDDCTTIRGEHKEVIIMKVIQALHTDILSKGLISDKFIATALINVYGMSGMISDAEAIFSNMLQRDLISWNVMLSVYKEQGCKRKALQLYRQMREEGIPCNQQSFLIIIKASSNLSDLEHSGSISIPAPKEVSLEILQSLHADCRRIGFASDAFVNTALLTAYKVQGALAEAENVFTSLPRWNVESWNAMLFAYTDQGHDDMALMLFVQMQKENMYLDDITLLSVLQACSHIQYMEICHRLHFDITSNGYEFIAFLSGALIHMYRSCASIIDAQEIFNGLSQPNAISWNECIASYADNGDCIKSLEMLNNMLSVGSNPNGITFMLLLFGCTQAGMITLAIFFLHIMNTCQIITDLKHYRYMIDLFARLGHVHGVELVLKSMPMKTDEATWLCLVNACHRHTNFELGKHLFDHSIHLKSETNVPLISLSSLYSDLELLESWTKKFYFYSLAEGG